MIGRGAADRVSTAGVLMLVLFAAAASAQQAPAPPPASGQPPLLSSTPTPPPGAMSEPSQMSGMPLQVGDLPPGTVAVRLIRRTFADNIVNIAVELRAGAAAGGQQSVSDAQGRAVFSGLRVGDTVRARAVVDGEALESQSFQLPAQGGVRLVLVAGVGAGVPAGAEPTGAAATSGTPFSTPSAVPPAARPAAAPSGSTSSPALRLTAVLVMALAVGGGVWWSTRPAPSMGQAAGAAPVRSTAPDGSRSDGRASPDPGALARPAAAPGAAAHEPRAVSVSADREQLFRELVALERMHEDGDVTAEEHQRRRDTLIAAIVTLDAGAASAPGD